MDVEGRFYAHFPQLALPHAITVLGGTLGRIPFEEFAPMDRQWARERDFERSAPVFWKRTDDTRAEDHMMLIFRALQTATARPYADPRSSMRYYEHDGSVMRRGGVFHRTQLIGGVPAAPPTDAELTTTVELAERWAAAELSAGDAIFAPLAAVAMVTTAAWPHTLAALPVLVALEGFLIPDEIDGIASAISRRCRGLLGPREPADLDVLVDELYGWRSALLHGRAPTERDFVSLYARLLALVAAVVRAMCDAVIERGLDGGDFELVLETLA